jgi:hypothetical protein
MECEKKKNTEKQIKQVKKIIHNLSEYAYKNKCDFSLLYKPLEDETEIRFIESDFNLNFVVSWRRYNELENIEISDSETTTTQEISFKDFIKCYSNFLKPQ